jgi:hypothetical protein
VGIFGRLPGGRAIRLLLPRALDRLRDLLVLFGHLREAVLPQGFRAGAMPLRRGLDIILA